MWGREGVGRPKWGHWLGSNCNLGEKRWWLGAGWQQRKRRDDRSGVYSGGRANRALVMEAVGAGVGKGEGGIKGLRKALRLGACSYSRPGRETHL